MSLLNEGLFFIDHRGKSVIAQQRRDAAGNALADESDILREAVEEAGWAAVFAQPGRDAVNVQFAVERIAEETLSALSAVLLRYPFKQVLLSYKGLEWKRESHDDSALAAARVWTAVREADHALSKQRLCETVLDPDSLLTSKDEPGEFANAAVLFEAWRRNGGRYFNGLPAMMRGIGADRHSHVLEITRENPGGVYRHVGPQCTIMKHFGEGFPVIAYPDPVIGRWAARRYRQIVGQSKPELTRTNIAESGGGEVRYNCLRLPWKCDSGLDQVTVMRINQAT